jgi:Flp pilus assembly protein TadG
MSPASSNRARRRQRTRGATSMEFGIVMLVFLPVLFACMDLGRYFLIEESLRSFAAEASRAALADQTVNPNNYGRTVNISGTYSGSTGFPTSINTGNAVNAIVPLLDPSQLSLTISQTSSGSAVLGVTVTATYNFTALVPLWSTVLNGAITETTYVAN